MSKYYSSVFKFVEIFTVFIGDSPTVSQNPIKYETLDENSTLIILSELFTDSFYNTFYWCFVGADSSSRIACCTCGEQCSQSDWFTHLLAENTCDSCEYKCSLTVNPLSIYYNGGTFFGYVRVYSYFMYIPGLGMGYHISAKA